MGIFEPEDKSGTISRLPIQIAILADTIRTEENPRLRLWIALELIETTLKWLFVAMSSAIYARNHALPKPLARTVAASIHKPTLAAWLDMTAVAAREVRRVRADDGFGVPFADLFERYVDGPEDAFTWARLKQFRINVLHGGGITETKASQQMKLISPFLDGLISELAEIHVEYDTVAVFDGVAMVLEGLEATKLPDNAPEPSGPGTWLIRKDGRQSGLQPILTYEPIREFWEIDSVRTDKDNTAAPVPQSYFKFENGQLYYTPIGVDDFVAIKRDTSQFERLFALRKSSVPKTILEQQYAQALGKHITGFVGRRREIDSVIKWLGGTIPAGGRIGLIVAGPGLGKSALIASVALEYRERIKSIQTNRSIFHAFSTENPQNDRRFFLLNICQAMQSWLGQDVERSASISDPDALLQKVQSLLENSRTQDEGRHMTVFVDALDEIVLFDPGFPEVLVRLAGAGITIVVTTRQEQWLFDFENAGKNAGKMERIPFLRGPNELPGMDEDDIRGLLLDRLGRRSRDIIALDDQATEGDRAYNPFIAKVVRLAEGKPLYIELLIVDLESGDTRIEANPRLPKRLEEFYGKLLGRQGVGDAKAHLAIVLCLLALVREPVQESWLAHLLSFSPSSLSDVNSRSVWVSNALREGQVFLSRTEPGAGTSGISLYHQELRRYLEGETKTGAKGLQWAFGMARWLLATAAAHAEKNDNVAIVHHFRRHGAEYILAHADSVSPALFNGPAANFVRHIYFSRKSLPAILEAWSKDHEAFLNSFARVIAAYSIKVEKMYLDQAFNEFANFILNHDSFEDGASIIHSVLGYREEDSWIYNGIVEAALVEPAEETAVEAFRRTQWMVIAGGAERRKGALDAAFVLLNRAKSRLEARHEVPAKNRHDARSVLHYEIGYVGYLRSDFDTAAREFALSVDAAKRGENWVSAHISESVRLRKALVAALVRGEAASQELADFRSYLARALNELLVTVRSDREERNRLSAERWIMNCHAHLFEIAWYERRAETALSHYENWLKDPWVAKVGERKFNNLHEKFVPRVNRLRKETERALAAYGALLPPLLDPNSPLACREGVAEFYLEYSEFCLELGRAEEARAIARSGLLTNDSFANAAWKSRLRKIL